MSYRSLFNLGVNIVSMIVFIVLLIISIAAGGVKKKSDKIFSILIGVSVLGFVVNTIFYSLVLNEVENDNLYLIYKYISVGMMYVGCFIALLYYLSYFGYSKKIKAIFISIYSLLLAVSIVILTTNNISDYYFTIEHHRVVQTSRYILLYIYPLIVLLTCFILACTQKIKTVSGKLSFIAFALIPLIAIIFHVIFEEYSILMFALCASFLFHFVYYYAERGRIINEQQNELVEQQIRIMISQIQPHFIYNCLSSISYLCRVDSQKAEAAIKDFSNYLRGNFSNLSQNKLVPFTKELEYTQNYLKLEKLRFEDRVNVKFNIRVDNFNVPSLSLQPIVENAVKHGICKKINGGTVTISTWDDDNNFYIRVNDDGVGFDINKPVESDNRVHVGLNNTKERIEKMCNGRVIVKSELNQGTTVTMVIPKESNNIGGQQ